MQRAKAVQKDKSRRRKTGKRSLGSRNLSLTFSQRMVRTCPTEEDCWPGSRQGVCMQAARAVQKSARKGRQKRKRQEAGAESVFRITEAEPLPENLLEHVEELAEVGHLTASAQLGSDLA